MKRLVFIFSIIQLAVSSCPTGFDLVSDGQCRGLYTTMKLNWDERAVNTAIQQCEMIDALPVIIHNAEQQAFWKERAWLLIAIVCPVGQSTWIWTDNSPVNFRPAKYDKALDKKCVGGGTWEMEEDGSWTFVVNNKVFETAIWCITQLANPVPSSDGCEAFEDDSKDRICYQVGLTAENFQDAQNTCRSFNGILASIHNDTENSFIRRLAVSKGAVTGMYLGAISQGNGKKSEWLDGSTWDYDKFYPGFPMNGLGNCVAMDTSGTSGEWVNVDCSSKQAVACQRKQHYTSPACTSGPWNEGDIIYTPGFPVDASTPCDYILSVDAGKRVQVEIFLLEANSCCDRLILTDNYIGGTIIANLTGEIHDKSYKSTTSNFMRVSWQPKGGKNVRGMMMSFHAV